MEEQRMDIPEEELPEEEICQAYTPRPRWQRIAAWIGFGIMIVGIALYYWQIATGGL